MHDRADQQARCVGPVGHRALARFIDAQHGLDDSQLCLGELGGADQRLTVLGKARTAKAGAGMQEFAADAPVETDAAGDVLDIGANRLTEIRHLVDKGDLGREKSICRIFDQLGGLQRSDGHRGFEQIERPIESPQHAARVLALGR